MNQMFFKFPGGETVESPAASGGLLAKSNFTLSEIISSLLPYIFTLAGLVLFIMLIMGGFGMLTSAGSPDKMKAAQGKITSAVIGFVIIFISYWLMRILEIVFGLNLLGA
jgi:hypothetical protein